MTSHPLLEFARAGHWTKPPSGGSRNSRSGKTNHPPSLFGGGRGVCELPYLRASGGQALSFLPPRAPPAVFCFLPSHPRESFHLSLLPLFSSSTSLDNSVSCPAQQQTATPSNTPIGSWSSERKRLVLFRPFYLLPTLLAPSTATLNCKQSFACQLVRPSTFFFLTGFHMPRCQWLCAEWCLSPFRSVSVEGPELWQHDGCQAMFGAASQTTTRDQCDNLILFKTF